MKIAMLGLLAQTEPTVIESNIGTGNNNIISLILHADIVVQIMMVVLFFFSIVSWAIIGSKHRQLKRAKNLSKKFFKHFWQAKSIDAVVAKGAFRKSPAFSIFKAGVDTLRENQSPKAAHLVEKEIRRATEDELTELEYGISFLATTSGAAPFIGLFGTVWGILNAFWKIGRTGASSIAIVGPHIAEALISTAVGLAAAIPALIFYNFYVNRIRYLSKDLHGFADDFYDRIGREYYDAV